MTKPSRAEFVRIVEAELDTPGVTSFDIVDALMPFVAAALDTAEARGRAEELNEVIDWLKSTGRADADVLTMLRTRAENLR